MTDRKTTETPAPAAATVLSTASALDTSGLAHVAPATEFSPSGAPRQVTDIDVSQPSLWIGKQGLDSLTVYGFFKDFSIEVGTVVSKLSLSIDGLSTAAKVEPIGGITQDQIDDINEALALAQSASALITSEASARTSADGALSTRIDNMVATVGANTTAISSEATARTTADQALGTRIDNISASVSSNVNLCPDVSEWGRGYGAGFGVSPYWGPAIQSAPAVMGEAAYAQSPAIPVGAGSPYTFSCDLIGFAAINGAYAEADMYAVNSAGNLIQYSGRTAPARSDFANGPSRYVINWTPPTGSVAVYVRLLGFAPNAGDIQVIGIRRPKLELGSTATSYTLEGQSVRNAASIRDEATARANADGALSTRIDTVTATAGANTSAITSEATARASADGQLFAKYGVTLDVNGYITGFQQNNNGQSGSFAINADNFSIGKPGGGARTEYSSGNWRIYDGAGQIRTRMGIW